LILPTATVSSHGLEKNDEIAEACLGHLEGVLDKRLLFVDIATRRREAAKKAAK